MRYLTDRKRAIGMGSAKTGTAHFWAMKVSSFALLILIPLFVFTFGPMLGALVIYFGWDLLFEFGELQLIIYASLIIILMLVLPNGLLSLGEDRRTKLSPPPAEAGEDNVKAEG